MQKWIMLANIRRLRGQIAGSLILTERARLQVVLQGRLDELAAAEPNDNYDQGCSKLNA